MHLRHFSDQFTLIADFKDANIFHCNLQRRHVDCLGDKVIKNLFFRQNMIGKLIMKCLKLDLHIKMPLFNLHSYHRTCHANDTLTNFQCFKNYFKITPLNFSLICSLFLSISVQQKISNYVINQTKQYLYDLTYHKIFSWGNSLKQRGNKMRILADIFLLGLCCIVF